ncbi:MAG: sel1 repeat family protein [Bacteroidales bacterium]|nr:sel1 repeat family protein [Bacteroidales bacterium]
MRKIFLALACVATVAMIATAAKKPKQTKGAEAPVQVDTVMVDETPSEGQATAQEMVKQQSVQAVKDSLNNILKRAQDGDVAMMNEVGKWYYIGRHVKQDYRKAYEWWKSAALKGDVTATANVAMCYQLGNGCDQDSVQAMRLYINSIQKGNRELINQRAQSAQDVPFDAMLLGVCYDKGYGVKRSPQEASKYFLMAADKGSVDGMRNAGLALLNSKKYTDAFPLFEKAAAQGDISSTYWAGWLMLGERMQGDDLKAEKYLRKAAEAGFPAAQSKLGNLYSTGKVVKQDDETALSWWRKAAAQGNGEAAWSIANAYLDGRGVTPDCYEVVQWMAVAYPSGYKRAVKTLVHQRDSIGDKAFPNYIRGMREWKVNKNYTTANDYFKKAEKAKCTDAAVMQYVLLADGNINPKADAKKAAKSLEKVAKTSPVAAYYLGEMYQEGNGVEKNMATAVQLLQQAADAGVAEAQCALGDIYYEGRGVDKDTFKAVSLYRDAERQQQLTETALTRLAQCYEDGEGGLAKDPEAAKALRDKKREDNLVNVLKAFE